MPTLPRIDSPSGISTANPRSEILTWPVMLGKCTIKHGVSITRGQSIMLESHY